jgi:hypothetical protein
MDENRARNEAISDLLRQGVPFADLASQFQISVKRVAAINEEAQERAASRKRAAGLRREMRAANDIDRRWPIETVMAALNLDARAHGCLERHLRASGRLEASLRDVMDFLVTGAGADADFRDLIPNISHRRLGKLTFTSLASVLCRANFGQVFREEWTKRRKQAAMHLVGSGLGRSITCILCCGGPPRGFR